MKIHLVLPIRVTVPAKYSAGKDFILNLNNYGNRFVRNKAKSHYEYKVWEEVKRVGANNLRLDECYTVFIHHPTNNNIDTANVLSVVDKFAMDAIQDVMTKTKPKTVKEIRILKDDSRKEVKGSFYFPGKTCPQNPHVEMMIFDNRKEFLNQIQECYDNINSDNLFHDLRSQPQVL